MPTDAADEPLREVAVRDVAIPLRDGTRLAGRLFLPADAEADPVPAILDFLPYRYSDLLAVRDSRIYPWFAARGYACARVDLRGTGNSTGIITDEYTEQEFEDAEEVIAWLADAPFSDGGVGMTGISWGGFNALQVAARRPRALKAIITLCASDDRYSDDVHYRGGCVLALEALQWATSMLVWDALPPDPHVVGPSWREEWRRRVEETPAFIEAWLSHQRRDDYWRHGSVCEDYSAIEVPVYAVGGWSDGYVDAVLRLLAGLPGVRKGLIGPWSHAYPNHSIPGPEIGWLHEALRWWDRFLKGKDTGIDDEPMLVAYVQDWTPPAYHHASWPGRFVSEATWPPPGGLAARTSRRYLSASLGGGALTAEAGDGTVLEQRGPQESGLEAGSLTADGGFGDWPADERFEDGASSCFTSAPLDDPVEILGNASVTLELAADVPVATVVARLCDVASDGTSLLVTRGMLNLTRRLGYDRTDPLVPGERVAVTVPLKAIGHRFPTGHRIRLALSSTYWPWLWPPPEVATLSLVCGEGSHLDLPVRPGGLEDDVPSFEAPERVSGMEEEVLASRPTSRRVTRDLVTGSSEVVFDWDVGGHVRLPDSGIEYDGSNVTTYRIRRDDPLSAEVTTVQSASLGRDGQFDVSVEARGTMSADAAAFTVSIELDAREEGDRVMNRQWSLRVARDGV